MFGCQAPLEFLLQRLHQTLLLAHFEHDLTLMLAVVVSVFAVVYFLIYENLELKIQLRKELSFGGVRFDSSESISYHRNLLQPYILAVSKN